MTPGLGHLHMFPVHFLLCFPAACLGIQTVTLRILVRLLRMTDPRTSQQVACFKGGTQITLSCTELRCGQGFASENKKTSYMSISKSIDLVPLG